MWGKINPSEVEGRTNSPSPYKDGWWAVGDAAVRDGVDTNVSLKLTDRCNIICIPYEPPLAALPTSDDVKFVS